jgi:hypothetical protein
MDKGLISSIYTYPVNKYREPIKGAPVKKRIEFNSLRPGQSTKITKDIKDHMRLVHMLNAAHWENTNKPKYSMRLDLKCTTLTIRRIK